jgi:hypothetical protein
MTIAFECPAENARGEGEYRFDGPKAHDGRFNMQREENGKFEATDMEIDARWVAADCGSVAPRR